VIQELISIMRISLGTILPGGKDFGDDDDDPSDDWVHGT